MPTPKYVRIPIAALACALLLTLGCKPARTPRQADSPAAADSHPTYKTPSDTSGEITGEISFSGKAPAATIDTSMDPACSLGSAKPELPTEQFVVHNGKLANVFVYVKSGPPEAMQAPPLSTAPVVLDQKNCRYVPHVIGVVQGGSVEFRNSDPTMHNIHTIVATDGNPAIDISQGPRGQPVTRKFSKPELMLSVRCNNHPWMNAFINVSATPYFAVTDADGHFDLRGLPPGTYTLGAVHEKLGEKTLQVTVASHGTQNTEFHFAQ